MNTVTLYGNITRDPELKQLPGGTSVVGFGLAVNKKYKDSQGNQQEKVMFIDCDCFGKRAEVIAQYFSKGSPILLQGELELQQWEKDGQRRSKHSIYITDFSFTSASTSNGGGGGGSTGGGGRAPKISHDDIPFSHGAWCI